MKNNNIIFSLILLTFSIFYLAVIIFQNRSLYLKKFNFEATKRQYDQSQWQQSQNISPIKELDAWALRKGYTGWNNYVDENKMKQDTEKVKDDIMNSIRKKGVSDATLYTYVGYEYVNGKDPTLLNPEHPPLGKYLIGLSIRIFNNENIILLVFGFITLVTVFTIVLLSSQSYLASSFSVFLTATHSLFVDQLIHGPQLELFQLTFFLLLILMLMLFENKRKARFLILSAFFLGCLLSVKTFATHFVLFAMWLFILTFFSKRFKLKKWLLLHVGGVLFFISSYAVFFIKGGNFRQWLGVQKYIVVFYKQAGINMIEFLGNYLRLIFTGSWKFWSDNTPISHYSEWSFTWSIIFILTIFIIIKIVRQKDKNDVSFLEWMLVSFITIYNLYLFIIPMFPRYLLLLFVPMIILISIHFNAKINYENSKK